MISSLLQAGLTRCDTPIPPSIQPRNANSIFVLSKTCIPRSVIGYAAPPDMSSALAVSALNTALARLRTGGHDATGYIVYSERGSQFRSNKYLLELKDHGLVGSIGSIVSAGDNATMESFFSLPQHRRTQHSNTGLPWGVDHCDHHMDPAPLPPAPPTKTPRVTYPTRI